MKRHIFSLLLLVGIVFGCSNEKDNNICDMDCTNVSETLKLNIVEDESNTSLISQKDQNAGLELKLHSLRLNKDLPYSIEKSTNYISFQIIGSDEIQIWLNGNLEDTIKVETKYIQGDCCGSLEIVKLSVNDALISKPTGYVIVIKK